MLSEKIEDVFEEEQLRLYLLEMMDKLFKVTGKRRI